MTALPRHRFVDHTAELQLEIEAPTREAALAEATVALGELVGPGRGRCSRARRQVSVSAPDDASLLAAWLDELVFLVESEGFAPEAAEQVEVSGHRASGAVVGALGEPRHLVKAVTYHLLDLSFDGRLWRGTVVLDV